MREEHISFVQCVLSYPNRSTDKTLHWLPDAMVQNIQKYHMSKPQIISFNLKCRSSGKVRARLASKPPWDDSGACCGRKTALDRRRGTHLSLWVMGAQGWFPTIKPQRWELSFPFEKQPAEPPGPRLIWPRGEQWRSLSCEGECGLSWTPGAVLGFHPAEAGTRVHSTEGQGFHFQLRGTAVSACAVGADLNFVQLVRTLSACAGVYDTHKEFQCVFAKTYWPDT